MTEREKVIRGFECCLRNDHKKCPYYSADILDTTCYTRLHTDALALLKEQEPRVMTLEEVRDSDDWMWIEYLSGYVEWQKQSDTFGYDEDGVMWNDATFYCNDSYGIEWRCWTSRPTEEQRKAVKWDD